MKKLILLSALYGAFFGINTMHQKIFLDHGSLYKHPKRAQHHGIRRCEHIARAYTNRNGDA